MRWIAIAVVLVSPSLGAEPRGRCAGGTCDVNDGPRPWVLTDDCQETSDVVGHQRCGHYGNWDAEARDPELALEIGFGLRHIVAPRPVVTDSTPSSVARTVGGSRPMADIVTTELRFTTAVRSFYLGGELAIGDLSHATYPYGAFVQGGGVFGLADALGPFDVAAEALFAGRSIRLTTNINRLAPASTDPVIELRARAAYWVTPWFTVTAEAGSGVLDPSEWVAAIGVGVHTRAFGGRR